MLLDLALKAPEYIRQAVFDTGIDAVPGDDLAGTVLGIGRNPQMQDRLVRLVARQQKAAKPCGLVEHADQNPGGKRVQGASMPGLAGPE